MRNLTFFLLLTLLLPTAAFANGGIALSDAYSFPTLKGVATGAAYVRIENRNDGDITITGAASPLAMEVQLHDHKKQENGVMQMIHLDNITVKAGDQLTLRPGGLHLMLMGLKQPLEAGDTLPLSLTLDDGQSLAFEATVRERP